MKARPCFFRVWINRKWDPVFFFEKGRVVSRENIEEFEDACEVAPSSLCIVGLAPYL